MLLDRRLLPFAVGLVATGIGFVLFGAETAVLFGLLGYFLTKIAQSMLWTATGNSRR